MMKPRWMTLAACGVTLAFAGCTKANESGVSAAEQTKSAEAVVDQATAPEAGAELAVERTVTVRATPADLWAFAGRFEAIANIAPVAENVNVVGDGIGATRSFEAGGARFVERLEAMEDGRSYTYTFVETPLPVGDYRGTITVADAGAGMASFTWAGTFRAKGVSDEEARKTLEDIYSAGIAEVQKRFPADS